MDKAPRVLAQNLRKRSTNTENHLWLFLKNRQLEDVKFRRQEPMGRYIVDFVSYDRKLIIELDGGQHIDNKKNDKERDDWFRSEGYEVLRFWDDEVFKNTDGVLEIIRAKLLAPHLTPLPQGARKYRRNKE